jgi:hypothetical protein
MAPAVGAATWVRPDGDGVLVFVHLQPGARRTAAAGLHGGRLKVAVAAPPLEGRANAALVRWLAAQLDVPPSRVRLVAGERSRDKTLRIEGADAGQTLRRLAPQ